MADQAEGAELKRTEPYQWPSGHISHLTEGQLGALERFKKLCQEKGYYSPSPGPGNPPTHDDETLLRYLRARKFIPQQAFTQFKETEDWRKENQLDALYETIDIDEYESTRRLYPQWTGCRDRRGLPFYVFEVNAVDAKAVTAYANSKDTHKTAAAAGNQTPWKMLKLFALYENLCRFVLPLCSALPERPHGETPISQSSNIVDLSGVGFTKIWSLRNHMSDASRLATAYYPETLDRIFVVGAPSFFPTIWQWAQRWFDPITVSKIFILTKENTTSTLEKYVELENIPKKYGGKLDWKFGDMPYLEPAIANSLRWREDVKQNGHRTLPIGPIKWQEDEDGDLVAVAVGRESGNKRQRVIAGLHPESGVARLALSPGRTETGQNLFHKTATHIPSTPGVTEDAGKQLSSAAVVAETSPEAATLPSSNDPTAPPQAALPQTSRAGTWTVPYRDTANSIAFPPDDGRQGTSQARFEQQAETHADGQLADSTPEIKTDGHGTRHTVMDPNTVGQAPKDHPLPEPEEPPPTILEQAKGVATSVIAAVGLGAAASGSGGGTETSGPKHDPEVDAMEGQNVEEFLRNRHMSKPQ